MGLYLPHNCFQCNVEFTYSQSNFHTHKHTHSLSLVLNYQLKPPLGKIYQTELCLLRFHYSFILIFKTKLHCFCFPVVSILSLLFLSLVNPSPFHSLVGLLTFLFCQPSSLQTHLSLKSTTKEFLSLALSTTSS